MVGIPSAMLNLEKGLFNIEHFCAAAYTSPKASPRMLPLEEIAQIKAKITALEQSRERCADSRIREVIDDWIKEQKDKLKSGGTRD